MIYNVSWARELAMSRMAERLPQRWAHVQAVATKAQGLGPICGADADLLTASAWLHDLGYAVPDSDGFHPLAGARYLQSVGARHRLVGLVANHSGAKYEAELRGLTDELVAFQDERSLVRDALWYCDMTTSPTGLPMSFDARLAEIRSRYGAEHVVARAITHASEEINAAIASVCCALREAERHDGRSTGQLHVAHPDSRLSEHGYGDAWPVCRCRVRQTSRGRSIRS